MPKVSKDSAPQRQEAGPVVDLRDELNGYRLAPTSDVAANPWFRARPCFALARVPDLRTSRTRGGRLRSARPGR